MIPGLAMEEGPLTAEWIGLGRLAADRFDVAQAYFDLCRRLYPGLDQRGQAAFLIGAVSYGAAGLTAWFALRGEAAASLAGLGVRVDAQGLCYRWDPVAGEAEALPLEAALSPLVERLSAEMRIGPRAQWRLVADSIAAAYQQVGQELGCAGAARQRALAIIAEGRTRNKQTGYHRIEMDGEVRHYLKRGGCCRWYTAEAGEYCATCVMRRPEDQVARLCSGA